MKYHINYYIEPTFDGKHGVVIEWMDENDGVICSGSAVVSRDPDKYVPILAADIRSMNEELFVIDAPEGEIINEV
jgi:ribosomal protein L14E/L6E/L27E